MVETRIVFQKAGQTGKYVLGQSVPKAFSLRLRKGKKRLAHVEALRRFQLGWANGNTVWGICTTDVFRKGGSKRKNVSRNRQARRFEGVFIKAGQGKHT